MGETFRPNDRVERVWAVAPGSDRHAISTVAWKEVVATVGAWSPAAAFRPVVEQRLWRPGARGPLQHTLAVVLHDPFGQLDEAGAAAEIAELVRPISRRRPLAALPAVRLRAYRSVAVGHIAELADADPVLPEGGDAFDGLFAGLVEGLSAMSGSVALSMLVAPARDVGPDLGLAPPAPDNDGSPRRERRVEFRLRLITAEPLRATLLARAEALCLARSPAVSSWRIPLNRGELDAARHAVTHSTTDAWTTAAPPSAVHPLIAALTMSLVATAAHPRRIQGRPVAGPLPSTGAVMGRVARPGGGRAPWRLDWAQRGRHVLLAGSSGCGKTTAILRLALDDVAAGRTVVLVDPHGDVATELAAAVPPELLVHIDPRLSGSAALDLLDPDPARSAAHVLSAVREVWPADFAGPTFHRAIALTLRGLHAALPERPTLVDVERFVTQAGWRAGLMRAVSDPELRANLEHEDAVWRGDSRGSGGGPSHVQYIAGKFAPLTHGPAGALFATAPRRALEADLARGAVVIAALPIGTLGTETARLVTRMFLSRLTAAVAAQGVLPPPRRRPVSVFCDEAHLMTGNSLAGLFAQARKFGTAIHVAVQAPSMLGRHLEEVLTNTQTHLLGRLPTSQAGLLVDRAGMSTVRVLPTLPRHHLVAVTEDHDPDGPPVVLTPVPPPSVRH